jgi:hypothetical protein
MNSTFDLEPVVDTIEHRSPPGKATQANYNQGLTMKTAQLHLDTIERQQEYVARQKATGGGVGVVFQDAFIRGMRDLGYKDPAWALAELIDNSVQAGANTIEIRFGFEKANTTQAKNPSQIAIIDNGTGMDPEMIGYAVRWGGTDREDDRNGFGRFGYGLPSSCVSIACKYTVYSRMKGGDWYSVHIDLEKLAAASADPKATEAMLHPRPTQLPSWVASGAKGDAALQISTLQSGTVIVLEDLDRLRGMSGWVAVKALRARLLQQFGVIYRHWIPEVRIRVDGDECQAVDPLFLLPHAMYVDETPLKAKKVDQRVIEVDYERPDGKRVKGLVKIRAAYLPRQFVWPDPDDVSYAGRGKAKNKRFEQVLAPTKGLNGILVCREGRQIDVVQPPWVKFQNDDVYIKIEIDFDPVLDELFSITTSKQQIRIDDDLWQKLVADGKNAGGLRSLVQDLRAQLKEEKEQIEALVANVTKQTTTELPAANAMVEAEKFKTKTPMVSKESQEEAERTLTQEVVARAKESGKPEAEVRTEIEAEIKKRPWDIDFKAIEEGPFYIPKRMGQQKRIVLNTAHPFYSRLYAKASGDVTAALEVLLFVLADGEIEALVDGQRATFYKAERHHWSELLSHALTNLVPQATFEDEASLDMEHDEQKRMNSR